MLSLYKKAKINNRVCAVQNPLPVMFSGGGNSICLDTTSIYISLNNINIPSYSRKSGLNIVTYEKPGGVYGKH